MASSAAPAAQAAQAPLIVDLGHNIYVKDLAEATLFHAWLSLPHPEIDISNCISELSGALAEATLPLKAYVSETITKEQEKRFALVAQKLDICICLGKVLQIFEDVAQTARELLAWENGEIDPDAYGIDKCRGV